MSSYLSSACPDCPNCPMSSPDLLAEHLSQSSAARILQELPRYNWLEQKILQRNSYNQSPAANSGSQDGSRAGSNKSPRSTSSATSLTKSPKSGSDSGPDTPDTVRPKLLLERDGKGDVTVGARHSEDEAEYKGGPPPCTPTMPELISMRETANMANK